MVGHSNTYYNVAVIPLLAPANRTATAAGASVDLQNYDAIAFCALVGASGDTLSGANRIELGLQESADNATWTPVANADMLATVAGGQATGTFGLVNTPASAGAAGGLPVAYETGYRGNLRYVRPVATFYGSTPNGTVLDVFALGGRPRQLPINN